MQFSIARRATWLIAIFALALFVLVVPQYSYAQDTWVEKSIPGPSCGTAVRRLVPDESGNLLMVGGGCPDNATNQVSVYNGTWTTLTAPTLPSIGLQSIAYDKARHQFVMFGGQNGFGTSYDRTWVSLDGITWTERFPANKPSHRSWAYMDYDEDNERVVLFGGCDVNYKGDLWFWDGNNWTEVTDAVGKPSARCTGEMVWDSTRHEFVLFGGGDLSGHDPDTYTLKGKVFTRHAVPGPERRQSQSMTFDRKNGNVVLYGGYNDSQIFQIFEDTWTWDGSWRKRNPAVNPNQNISPDKRTFSPIGYDPTRMEVVMASGRQDPALTALSDTWIWQPEPPIPTGPPTLFVHGWCGDAVGTWANIINNFQARDSGRYGPLNSAVAIYYDYRTDSIYDTGPATADTRIFSLGLTNDSTSTGDSYEVLISPVAVANTRIVSKAWQLKQAIDYILGVTHTNKVNIVGHSQGGLVARAYVEGLACEVPYLDERNGADCPGFPSVTYGDDVDSIVTIDTPHLGGSRQDWKLDQFEVAALVLLNRTCAAATTTSLKEMYDDSNFIKKLNKTAIPGNVKVASISSYVGGQYSTNSTNENVALKARSDGIVNYNSQNFKSVNPMQGTISYFDERNISNEDNPIIPNPSNGCPYPSHPFAPRMVHDATLGCTRTADVVDRYIRNPLPQVSVENVQVNPVDKKNDSFTFDVVFTSPLQGDATLWFQLGSEKNLRKELFNFSANQVTLGPFTVKRQDAKLKRVYALFPVNVSLIDSVEQQQ